MHQEIEAQDEAYNRTNSEDPIVIIIRGIPGSGKSHLATALQEYLGKENVEIIDPDTIDLSSTEYLEHSKLLTKNNVEPKFHKYRFLMLKANEAIASKKIVIWDQPFIDLEGFKITVENLQTHAHNRNIHLKTLIVEIEIDEKIAKSRVIERKRRGGHGPSDKTFHRFANQFTSFNQHGHMTIQVSGQSNISLSVNTINKELNKLWN